MSTAKDSCHSRWPSLLLTCRQRQSRFYVISGTLSIASGKSADSAWRAAYNELDKETVEMYRTAYDKAKLTARSKAAKETLSERA